MGLGKRNGEKKGFLAAVMVGRGFGGGRTGCQHQRRCQCRWVPLEGEQVWGGNFWRGEMKSFLPCFICIFFKKKIAEDRRTWHIPRHLRDYCSITKVMVVSLLQNACQV
jgi:hypothetical protein